MTWTERDVNRTDRQHSFFSGNENPGLALLHDVLMTYCMFNFDLGKCGGLYVFPPHIHQRTVFHKILSNLFLGYVQGMSDLLAPLLFVTQNEVESFWCLTGFMELVVSKHSCLQTLYC